MSFGREYQPYDIINRMRFQSDEATNRMGYQSDEVIIRMRFSMIGKEKDAVGYHRFLSVINVIRLTYSM